ncbi:hypothetical protein TIFTF001_020854 [Ficus carica]|uniref:Protein kinase domain-containing protein n=1 Tax=Ficus carica TaxID=3494 RepID=A0AA88AYD5_FICCA|nr:hypothetical protein TIFTF001_020854 [Ficus carica]
MMIVLANLAGQQGAGQEYHKFHCREATCGENGPRIRFPFRLNDTNNDCGYPGFELSCVGNETALHLPISPIKSLLISKIDYKLNEIEVYSHDTSSYCLAKQLVQELFSIQSVNLPFKFRLNNYVKKSSFTLVTCPNRECGTFLVRSNSEIQSYLYYFLGCTKMHDIESVPDINWKSFYFANVTLTWSKPDCKACEAKHKGCKRKIYGAESDETECFDIPGKGRSMISAVICTLFIILGSLIFIILVVSAAFYIYTAYKNDRETRIRIEKFLEDYIALKPSRYSYADMKKITNEFKDKLGEGAYGTVFKGKLSDDVLVAVKILNHSKGDGEEFLNEVSTIGQIYHINVVRLVGYSAEGFKRALVYEFSPNGSLEKYISSAAVSGNHLLSWETLHDIALGIAKGIEYLHQGCDQRILHFDIKPQNILLDHNFKPKISDFGLAKLCSKDQSIVSMTATRGTIGYIAPEVFSKNFGNVSYKSDVYSFGMLLLEMVGGRKSTNVTNENTDEIYYPEWIYNILLEGEDHRIQIEGRGDAKIAKKIAIVGLWCIQWHPMGRPAMKAVVQMLEGAEELTMPPNPFTATGPISETDTKIPARRMILELETIVE